MDVYLCFPPGADPAMPHASLPAIGAQLREDGKCNYFLRDLNLEAFLYFLTEKKVSIARERVARRVKDKAFRSLALFREAQRLLEDTGLPGRMQALVEGYRDPQRFYTPDTYLKQKEDFNAACRMISLQYDGIQFDKYSLFESFSYNSFEEIRAALDDPDSAMLAQCYREIIIPEIEEKQPGIVGISVSYFSQLIPCFLLAGEIRRISPGTHVIAGGPVITWGKNILVRQAGKFATLVDSFCMGEGEGCVSGLVNALINNNDLDSVPNLVYYRAGKACVNKVEHRDISLGKLPTPDYTNMPLDNYLAPERILSLPLTKGCYYNRCKFCNYAFIKLTDYRERPLEMVVKDIERIVEETGDRVFSFESDVIRPAYLLQFSRALLNARLSIKWHSVMRFEENLDQAFFDTLARAGCIRMYLGLESGNPRLLKEMDKGTTIEVIENTFEFCRKAGIATEVGVFLGYPGEKVEEAVDTLNFIKRNRDNITRADAGFFRLLKGAPVLDEMHSLRLLPGKSQDDYWFTMEYHNPVLETHRETFDRIFNEMLELYPMLKTMDISEEILYIARYGKDVIKRVGKAYSRRNNIKN